MPTFRTKSLPNPPSLAYDLSFSSGVQQRSAEHPFYPRTQKDPRRKKRPKRRRSREIIQVYWTRELEHDFELLKELPTRSKKKTDFYIYSNQIFSVPMFVFTLSKLYVKIIRITITF